MGEFSPEIVKASNREVYKGIREGIRDYSSRVQAACNFAVDVMDWLQEHHSDRPPYFSEWEGRIEIYNSSTSIFIYKSGGFRIVRRSDDRDAYIGEFKGIDLYSFSPDIWLGNFESLIGKEGKD